MSLDQSFDTRSHAMTVAVFQGKTLKHIGAPDTSVRVFRNAPGTAIVQLRHFSGARQTILSASLDRDELEALRALLDVAIADLEA